jgi:hypothetical protein
MSAENDTQMNDFFSNLRDRSITLLENFTCCNTCGFEQVRLYRQSSDIGFCFYHQQDTRRASETGILWLSWGSYTGDEIEMITVAEAIVDEAKSCKLEASWQGAATDRIKVTSVPREYFTRKLEEEGVDDIGVQELNLS